MIRRSLLAVVLCLVAAVPAPALAQEPARAAAPAVAVRVILETTAGTILVETDPRAPVTAANFLRYVDEGRFDGTDFYRGMELGAGTGVVQGGTANAPDRILPPIAHEPTSQTGLRHVDGALSMARFDPGTADGDFFIIVGNLPGFDAGRSAPGDAGFAVFGRVVEGMDVVRAILAAPKSPTEGEGFMRGQMLDPRVRIVSARRVETAPPPVR
ncbi:peptidylprolyl isomerase [Brevundimonas sp.]|uniref:peptidylprolyl isomerase n=1 Tax=Brevundimonas sp. TaxID=1871086 RepID=UPI002D2F4B4A|nr:peptidylprolyl isomerase [Brevundimonas sp.]HYC96755.1 peptidylprolyl isomerase [Brevundimonas sp.]